MTGAEQLAFIEDLDDEELDIIGTQLAEALHAHEHDHPLLRPLASSLEVGCNEAVRAFLLTVAVTL